jgi:hypothetical protein
MTPIPTSSPKFYRDVANMVLAERQAGLTRPDEIIATTLNVSPEAVRTWIAPPSDPKRRQSRVFLDVDVVSVPRLRDVPRWKGPR